MREKLVSALSCPLVSLSRSLLFVILVSCTCLTAPTLECLLFTGDRDWSYFATSFELLFDPTKSESSSLPPSQILSYLALKMWYVSLLTSLGPSSCLVSRVLVGFGYRMSLVFGCCCFVIVGRGAEFYLYFYPRVSSRMIVLGYVFGFAFKVPSTPGGFIGLFLQLLAL